MVTAQNIQLMPKIDLHRHLEGSIRPETIFELSKDSPYYQAKYNLPELYLKMKVNGTERTLADFITKLGTRYMIEFIKSKEDLTRFAFEACEDAAHDGVVYLELRCTPSNYYQTPLTADEFIQGVYEGIEQAALHFGIKTGLILSIKREEPFDLNEKMVQLVCKYFDQGIVVGVDLSGNEPGYPTRRYKELFHILDTHSVPITIHAGESQKENARDSVIEAITQLHALRIGHGTAIAKSAELLSRVRNEGILIESCPTSTVHSFAINSIENHPVHIYYKKGIPQSINTDDPITSNITLTSEYENIIMYHNFSSDDLRKLNLHAITYSFLPLDEKRQLKYEYLELFDSWQEQCNRKERILEHVQYKFSYDQMGLPKLHM